MSSIDDDDNESSSDDWLRFQDDQPAPCRVCCKRCRQPQLVCICSSLPDVPIVLQNHVYVLQHPLEVSQHKNRSLPIVQLCLDASCLTVHTGRRLPDHTSDDDDRLYWLLLPSRKKDDSSVTTLSLSEALLRHGRNPDTTPITLLCLDATWQFTQQMDAFHVKKQRYPKRLWRVQLTESDVVCHRPNRFAIRNPPSNKNGQLLLCTAECIAYVLAQLEDNPAIYDTIMNSVDAMVDNWNRMKNNKNHTTVQKEEES